MITEAKIMELIKKAYEIVLIYIRHFNAAEEISKISDVPIICKRDFIDAQEGCINPEYYMKYMRNELKVVRTSGSTGHYLQIMWDKSDYHHSMAELWLKRIKYYNIYPHSRLAFFFTDSGNTGEYIIRENEQGIPKTELMPELIDRAYKSIMEWDPEWMLLQPSTAVLLTEYVRRSNKSVPDSLQYIELSGEMLADDMRRAIRETFKVAISDQYGANEVNSIAYECPEGNMHIMTSNVYVEIVDSEDQFICDSIGRGSFGKKGRVILASLTNKAMPFIRYDIGDMGEIIQKECSCGCSNFVLRLCGGRDNDFISMDKVNRISPYIFVSIFDRINDYFDGAIIQFYIEQIRYDLFEIKIFADEEVEKKSIIRCFKEFLNIDFLRKAEYKIEFVNRSINTGTNGKYSYFRNKIGSCRFCSMDNNVK